MAGGVYKEPMTFLTEANRFLVMSCIRFLITRHLCIEFNLCLIRHHSFVSFMNDTPALMSSSLGFIRYERAMFIMPVIAPFLVYRTVETCPLFLISNVFRNSFAHWRKLVLGPHSIRKLRSSSIRSPKTGRSGTTL